MSIHFLFFFILRTPYLQKHMMVVATHGLLITFLSYGLYVDHWLWWSALGRAVLHSFRVVMTDLMVAHWVFEILSQNFVADMFWLVLDLWCWLFRYVL